MSDKSAEKTIKITSFIPTTREHYLFILHLIIINVHHITLYNVIFLEMFSTTNTLNADKMHHISYNLDLTWCDQTIQFMHFNNLFHYL